MDSKRKNGQLNKNQRGISVPIQNGEFLSGKEELKGIISENINEKDLKINAKFNYNIQKLIVQE